MALAVVTEGVSRHQELARDYLPKLFANDPLLTELNLDGTSCNDIALSALCDALRTNTALRKLSLQSNGISDAGAAFVSEVLLSNSVIEAVLLQNNSIGHNGARSLCLSMESNNTLMDLDVSMNPIDSATADELNVLTRLNSHPPHLKQTILSLRRGVVGEAIDLSRTTEAMSEYRALSHDDRRHLDDWCTAVLAMELKGNSSVTLLDLSHQHIGDEGARALSDMIRDNRALQRIHLTGNLISSVGAGYFVDALESCNTLQCIDLQGNSVSNDAIVSLECALALNRQPLTLKHFYPLLHKNDPHVAHLELDDHASQRFYDDITARLLSGVLCDNTCLLSLAITNGKISHVGARFMSDVLLRNQGIRSLDLSHNDLGIGSKYIAEALQRNRSLQCLRLVNTSMGDEEASAFATMLELNSTLVELDLSCNPKISVAGEAFARSFNLNTTLSKLELAGTTIAEKTMKEIEHRRLIGQQPERLRKYLPLLYARAESLRDVDMSGGEKLAPLRDTSCEIIAAPLASNYAVTKLNLSNNRIGYSGVVSLAGALLENRVTLKELNLSDNPIGHGFEFGQLLSQLIRTHMKLAVIHIANTEFDTEGCEQIAADLGTERLNVVKSIDMTRNPAIDPKVYFKAMTFLRCNSLLPSFKEQLLKFHRRWEDDERRASNETRIADFSAYDGSSGTWKEPDSVTQEVFDGAAEVVCDIMARVNNCTKFLFAQNSLSDRGIEAVAKLIARDTRLSSFDISGNHITDAGADAILQAVRSSYNVREVILGPTKDIVSPHLVEQIRMSLTYNAQSKDVKELLVTVSRNSPALTKIDFCNQTHDHLTDDHITLLCNALGTNHFVASIDISNNHVTNLGLRRLANLLKDNTSIKQVSIKNTLIYGPEVAEILLDLFASTKTALRKLDISYSELTDESFPLLMKCIESNRNITLLGLNKCDLAQRLVDQLCNTLSLNEASALRGIVMKLRGGDPSVTTVQMSAKGLTDPQAAELLTALSSNPCVTDVDVSENGLSDYTGTAIAECLKQNRSITKINFSRNVLGPVTIEALASALASNCTLQVLDLSQCKIQRPWIAPLEQLLQFNETLHTLDLDGNDFDVNEEGTLHFVRGVSLNTQPTIKHALPQLAANSEEIVVLDASKDVNKNDVGAERIGSILIENTHLQVLVLTNGRITDVGARALCRGLNVNRTVTKVDVSHNRIGDVGAYHFSSVLQVNSILRALALHGNPDISVEGFKQLHAALQQNNSIVDLSVAEPSQQPKRTEEDIPPDVAVRTDLLFQAQLNSWHPRIKELIRKKDETIFSELDLSDAGAVGKTVDDQAVSVLCESLKGDNFLHTLDISKNKLSFSAGYSIADLLLHNRRLTSLDLSGNAIYDGSMTIVDAMHVNSTVTSLNLSHNGCSPLSLEKLDLLLALNREPQVMKPEVLKMLEKDATHSKVCINVPVVEHIPNRKPQMDDNSVAIVTRLLHTDLIVKELDFSWNGLRDAALCSLGDLIKSNPLITTLRLAHNYIGDNGVQFFCSIVRKSQELTYIDLSCNVVTSSATDAVLEALHVNPVLSQFKLEGNKILREQLDRVDLLCDINTCSRDQLRAMLLSIYDNSESTTEANMSSLVSLGQWSHKTSVSILARALAYNIHLHSLLLEFNDITDAELDPLCMFLQSEKSKLVSLSLAQNHLVDVSKLCSSLARNTALRSLDIRSNRLEIVSAKAIAEFVRQTKTLTELDVGNNSWGRNGVVIIIAALPLNDSITSINVAGKNVPQDLQEQAEYFLTLHYSAIELHDEEAPAQPAGQESQQPADFFSPESSSS